MTNAAPSHHPISSETSFMRLAFVALVAVTGLHLSAQLSVPNGSVASSSQVFLMPLLLLALWAGTRAPRGRLVTLVLVALLFSWSGDTLPRFFSGDAAFLAMVAGFLVAQVFYILAFQPSWRRCVLTRPWWLTPYAVVFVVLIALCYENAGPMLVPVIVYGLALVTMAVLATGLGRLAAVGGAVFLVSDSLIALRAFADISLPSHSFWVMLTYVLGQALLVVAVGHRVDVHRGSKRVQVSD